MKRIGKTAAVWFFVLLLLGAAILPVFADDFDIDYSGVTDDVTGEPIGGDVEPGDVRVWICGNEYYDPAEGRFIFILPASGFAVSANVADGMVTTERVRISVPNGVDAALFRNGQKIDPSEFDGLTVPGKYVLTVSDGGKSLRLVSFTIVGNVTGALNEYRLPTGFAVTGLLFNGQEKEFSMRVVDMTAEGRYEITYYCQGTAIPYTLRVTVDHTAPVLALAAVKDGVAKDVVDISDLPADCSIYIEHDGRAMAYTPRLKEGGSYVITVTDPAGNATTYKFMIQVYLNSWGNVLCAAAVVLVAGLGIYLIHSRRHLKVR